MQDISSPTADFGGPKPCLTACVFLCVCCSAVHLAVCSSLPFLRSHQHSDDWFDLAPADVCGALPGIRAALPPQGTQREQRVPSCKVSQGGGQLSQRAQCKSYLLMLGC